MTTEKQKTPRLHVVMTAEDNKLFLAIKWALEKRAQRNFSQADIVREALKTQAQTLSLKV